MATLFGTDIPDSIVGGDGDDVIYGWTSENPDLDPYGVGDDDTLDGGAGDDTLYGGNGADVLIGGAGDDLIVDHDDAFRAPHKYDISAGEGDDTIRLKLTVYEIEGDAFGTIDGGTGQDTLEIADGSLLGDLDIVGVETLSFRGGLSGSAEQFESFDSINFGGAPGGTLILSKAGSMNLTDELAAMTGVSIMGSAGDDRIEIDNPDGVEIRGEAGDDTLIGGAGKDWLMDFEGSNRLEGRGGDDRLEAYGEGAHVDGGAGDDQISLGSAKSGVVIGGKGHDIVEMMYRTDLREIEFRGIEELRLIGDYTVDAHSFDGVDKIVANGTPWPNLHLAAAGRFELDERFVGDFEVTGSAGDDFIRGRDDYDILRGRAGDDTIEGGGDLDRMDGGEGVDTLSYRTSDKGVTVSLKSGYASGGDAEGDIIDRFENVVGSSFKDRLDGDGLSNVLEGRGGDDRLDGRGGADSLIGGKGDDVYVVDDIGDRVIELGKGGNDAVTSKVDFSLIGQAIEDLRLVGKNAVEGIGNELANTLSGNGLANTLDGRAGDDVISGGAGADILKGGSGDDVFVFSAKLGSGNVDHVSDFKVGQDVLSLDHEVFAGLAAGNLQEGAFVVGAAATDTDHRIIYDDATGALSFDRDGSGARYEAVEFATLKAGLRLSHDDLQIV